MKGIKSFWPWTNNSHKNIIEDQTKQLATATKSSSSSIIHNQDFNSKVSDQVIRLRKNIIYESSDNASFVSSATTSPTMSLPNNYSTFVSAPNVSYLFMQVIKFFG